MKIPSITMCLCLVLAGAAFADELTPSGGPREAESGTSVQTAKISFEDAARDLTAVYPIQLDSFDQVLQNSFNWSGPLDASMRCEIGFTPEALVIRGTMLDDHPFHQTLERPAMPDWWRIPYGADGMAFDFDDPTSASRRLSIALNYGSRAIKPRIELLASPQKLKPGFIPSADFELLDAPAVEGSGAEKSPPILFRVAIPFAALAEGRFFSGPLRITVRLFDLDGDWSTFCMMQETVEKK